MCFINDIKNPLRRALRSRPGLFYEIAAVALVVAYVNAFELWQPLTVGFGATRANALPVALLVVTAAVVAAFAIERAVHHQPVRLVPLAMACVLAIAAALLTNPQFPAKRIHVLQYVILAIIVARALRFQLTGGLWLGATALLTAILGSHDELAQGLFPNRTFGLIDFVVDVLSGLAGALVSFAFAADEKSRIRMPVHGLGGQELDLVEWLSLAVLTVGWLLLIVAIPAFRGGAVPFWPLVPLTGGAMGWALASSPGKPTTGARAYLTTVAVLMLATAIYPLSTHAFSLVVH